MESLENRIGRQMFKLIVESTKICRILFDNLELDMDDFDELYERCIKKVKHLNGVIEYPFIKDDKNDNDEFFFD